MKHKTIPISFYRLAYLLSRKRSKIKSMVVISGQQMSEENFNAAMSIVKQVKK